MLSFNMSGLAVLEKSYSFVGRACCFRENYFRPKHTFKACCCSSEAAALWPAPLVASSLRSPAASTVALLPERAVCLNVCHHMTLKQTFLDTQHPHSHPCNLKTKQYNSNIYSCFQRCIFYCNLKQHYRYIVLS